MIDFYSKKQATVETATYGSEFIAGKTAVDRAIDIRLTLRYLGVPIKGRTIMFGDNESMIKSAKYPHSVLKKRHNALAFHRVREAIASNMLSLHHISGEMNPADILSKHWGYRQVWPILQPILYWRGNTNDCAPNETKGSDNGSSLGTSSHGEPKVERSQARSASVHFTKGYFMDT